MTRPTCPYCGASWPASESEAAYAHLWTCPKNPGADRRSDARDTAFRAERRRSGRAA
jgi:hypothetical protein